jgi:hypothetical protein
VFIVLATYEYFGANVEAKITHFKDRFEVNNLDGVLFLA